MKTTLGLLITAAGPRFLRNRLGRPGHGMALAALGRTAALLLAVLGAGHGIAHGQVVTGFPIPTPFSDPRGIAAGPDGNLWFVEWSANQIGRISTAGDVTEFPIPTADRFSGLIAAGPDGAL
jgi:virginiamycin B lyase